MRTRARISETGRQIPTPTHGYTCIHATVNDLTNRVPRDFRERERERERKRKREREKARARE